MAGFSATRTYPVNDRQVPKDIPELVSQLRAAIEKGGCVCIIRNTVRDAQEAYMALREATTTEPENLFLLHARFPYQVREAKENAITSRFGLNGNHPKSAIVVGTQVLEQSLDLDFDLMVTTWPKLLCYIGN